MSTSSRGNAFELEVAAILEGRGYCVGSRRHRGGSGDLIAHHASRPALLVEAKTTLRPYDHFGPADRAEMASYCERHGLKAVLAWRVPRGGGKVRWVSREGWPK